MNNNDKFLGKIVYLKTDPDNLPRLCICKKTYIDGSVQYDLNCGNDSSCHFVEEMTIEKPTLNFLN